jgi:hypothetical protein
MRHCERRSLEAIQSTFAADFFEQCGKLVVCFKSGLLQGCAFRNDGSDFAQQALKR